MDLVTEEKWIDKYFGDLKQFDCLEIGALDGLSTKYLSKHFKRVFVIDPWDGRQQGESFKYNLFLENTSECQNVYHIRSGSETQESKEWLKSFDDLKIGFSFIDGLHTTQAVINDFNLSSPYMVKNGLILVDDCEFPPVNTGADTVKYSPNFEGYTELDSLYKKGISFEDFNMMEKSKAIPDYSIAGYGLPGTINGHTTVRIFKKID